MSSFEDRVMFKLGELTNAQQEGNRRLTKLEEQSSEILSHLSRINSTCAVRGETLQGYGERIEDLEEKDVLGGVNRKEKLGLWGSAVMAVYVALRIVAQFFGVKLP